MSYDDILKIHRKIKNQKGMDSKVDTAIKEKISVGNNATGVVRMVDIEKIIKPDYQRPLKESSVSRIVKNFDHNSVGILTVSTSPSCDGLKILDGQHRLEALRRMGYSEALCQVIEFDSEESERNAFVNKNTSSKVTQTDKFRTRFLNGDRKAIDLFEVARHHKFAFKCLDGVDVQTSGEGVVTIQNVSEVIRVGDTGEEGVGILDKSFRTWRYLLDNELQRDGQAYRIIEKELRKSKWINSLITIHRLNPDNFDNDRFLKVIRKDPGTGWIRIVGMDQYSSTSGDRHYARGIAAIYNKNLTGDRRIIGESS